ncbi:MAG: hypothetical protein KDA65_11635 [Planctomycetaceae bacterium]|nr:hypothetical protein [Planctomycetaceae bacterium]
MTDAEVLEQAVIDLTDDVQQNRQEQVLDQISEEAVVLRGLISTGMARYQLEESLRISDLNVEMQADGKSAKAHLRANGTVSDRGSSGVQGQRFPSRWNLYFEREGDDWKISKIERLSPTSGKSMPILATRIQ